MRPRNNPYRPFTFEITFLIAGVFHLFIEESLFQACVAWAIALLFMISRYVAAQFVDWMMDDLRKEPPDE